jgi:hypothetical protein
VLLLALFYAGWLFLPWLWAVNVWMFWLDFRHGDVVVKTCEQPEQQQQQPGELKHYAYTVHYMFDGSTAADVARVHLSAAVC